MQNEELANEFLRYINSNYKQLLSGFQKSSFKKEITDDVFHDSLLAIYNSINKKGFRFQNLNLSGKSFENLLFVSCCNNVLLKKNIIKNRGHNLSFDSDDIFQNHVYLKSEFEYDLFSDIQNEKNKIEEDVLVSEIRKYINKTHTQLEVGIFEFYFRSGLSMKKIGEMTNYSTRTIFLKINKVKDSVIQQFANNNLSHRLIIKEEKEKIKFKKIKKSDLDSFYL